MPYEIHEEAYGENLAEVLNHRARILNLILDCDILKLDAKAKKKSFDELLKVGFTEEQAINLVGRMVIEL